MHAHLQAYVSTTVSYLHRWQLIQTPMADIAQKLLTQHLLPRQNRANRQPKDFNLAPQLLSISYSQHYGTSSMIKGSACLFHAQLKYYCSINIFVVQFFYAASLVLICSLEPAFNWTFLGTKILQVAIAIVICSLAYSLF